MLPEAIKKVGGRFSASTEPWSLAMASEARVPGGSTGRVATAHSNTVRAIQPVVLSLRPEIHANVHAS